MEEKDKKKVEKKSFKNIIKALWNNSRGRSLLFFACYLVFFFFIIVGLRSNYQSTKRTSNNPLQQNIVTNYKLDGIASGNYYFSRVENLNGVVSQFEGKSCDQKSEVMMSRNGVFARYFMYGGIVIENENGVSKVSSDPYVYGKFGIYRYISSILEEATLISKTDYPGGNSHYQYQISTTTLVKILDNLDIDIADSPNLIELEVGSDKNVIGITYYLDSYASYVQVLPTTLEIKLSYDRFGEVEAIEIPS